MLDDPTPVVRDPARLAAVRRTGLLDSAPEEVFDRLTRLATRVLDVPVSFLSVVDEDRDFYKSQCGFGEPLASTRELPGPTFCHYTIPSDRPLVINDTRADPVYREVPTVESLGVAAYAGIPLISSGGQPIGSFCAIDFEPRQWTQMDVEVLMEFAASAMREIELRAEIAERLQAEAELRAQLRISALGFDIGMVVTEGGTPGEVLQRCSEAMVSHLDAALARVWTVDGSEPILKLQASAGPLTALAPQHDRIPVGQGRIGRIAAERRPHLSNDVPHDPWASDAEWARRVGVVSFAGHPLVVDDRLLGVLAIFAHQPLLDRDVQALQSIVDRIALAVERHHAEQERIALLERERRARSEAERRAVEEAALRRAAHAVTASFTVEETSRQIAQSALVATSAAGAFVEWIDLHQQAVEVIATAGAPVPPLGFQLPYPGSLTQRVVERMEPEVIPTLREVDHPLPEPLTQSCGECSALVIPLLDAGEPIGALFLLRPLEQGGFHPDEQARARTFGDLAALAFRKIHLLEESERRSREIERITESRARLVRGFSHDLKNPLGAADGHAALLMDGILGKLSERQQHSVERIRASIRSALALINDLVELARAEAGQVEVQPAPTEVREVVLEIAGEYRAQAETAGLSLDTELPDRFPTVESDPSRVRQILGNLISNAIKYNRENGRIIVRVELRARDAASGEPWIAVEVSDTGVGIPADKLHLLFREFSRLEPGASHGAGLGLAISQKIAHALGGEITVESRFGSGSTFVLWLPTSPGPATPRQER